MSGGDDLDELARMNARARARSLHYAFRVVASLAAGGVVLLAVTFTAVLVLGTWVGRLAGYAASIPATAALVAVYRYLERRAPVEPD